MIDEEGNLVLRRAAVGDHILLGGDNMDLTLAYAMRAKLAQKKTNLDNWQFRGLVQSCRKAKERLLNDPALEKEPLVVLGRGTSLIGGTIRTELTRRRAGNHAGQWLLLHWRGNRIPGAQTTGWYARNGPALCLRSGHYAPSGLFSEQTGRG
ncbi:MAG: hypothetical protein R3E79_18220 [Caldilineaceae bacterium]